MLPVLNAGMIHTLKRASDCSVLAHRVTPNVPPGYCFAASLVMTVVACVGQCWACPEFAWQHRLQKKRSFMGLLELRSWRNGSAPDSRSGGWEFKSLRPHSLCFCSFTWCVQSFRAALSPCRLRNPYCAHTQIQCKPNGSPLTSCDMCTAMRSIQ